MTAGSWGLWILLSTLATAASVWHYRRRETPGRGRMLLAALRAGAIAVLLLLLFDPELPARGAGGGAGTQVLLDGSLSMNVRAADGRSAWAQGVAAARARAGGRPVLVFGDAVHPLDAAALPDSAPGEPRSRLLPALQAAAEAGARRVVVITDGRLEDADAVARWAPRLGVEVVPEFVGGDVANRALAEASAPTWAEAGQPIPVDFGVAATGTDAITVVVRHGERVVGRTAVAGAGPGRLATGALEVRIEPPVGGGWLPLSLAIEGRDDVPDDDTRIVWVHVAAEPPGIALVSFRPDWEPRFLAPVLEQSLGLPLRAFIRSATGQFVRLAGGLDAGATATEDDVRRALGRAEVVVLHGVGSDAPAWAEQALSGSGRLLVFPGDGAERLSLPLTIGDDVPGDWYPAHLPPSPLAPLLAGQELSGLTPLSAVRSADVPAGAWSPLLATRGRGGASQPAILAGEAGRRRWVVALGSGWWQWAFRGGEERQLYQRLWGGVAGWLARDRDLAGPEPVRPGRRASPRGLAIPWIAPGLAADSIAVTLTGSEGATALDTVVVLVAADTAWAVAPPPGHYRFHARAFSGADVTEAAGEMTVERYSPDFSRPVVDPALLRATATSVRDGDARRGGTPLHATAYPYVLIVLLLATEWVLRRRWGLR